jgi:transposase
MYPSDLTDSQWAKLEPLLQQLREDRHGGGRPRKYPLRRVADALFYVVKTGCQWRQLPVDFPPWQTVYQQFRTWRMRGTWERVNKRYENKAARRGGETSCPAWRLSILSRPGRR